MSHSGKKLSEVPYEEITVGMEVLSVSGTPGKVKEKINKEEQPNRENDNFIITHWSNGNISYQFHFEFNNVTVK